MANILYCSLVTQNKKKKRKQKKKKIIKQLRALAANEL